MIREENIKGKYIQLRSPLKIDVWGNVNYFSCTPSLGRIFKVLDESDSHIIIKNNIRIYKDDILSIYKGEDHG